MSNEEICRTLLEAGDALDLDCYQLESAAELFECAAHGCGAESDVDVETAGRALESAADIVRMAAQQIRAHAHKIDAPRKALST